MHPDQLLSQIRDLLAQYIQMGPDTPVAQEAQGLADAIDQTMGMPGRDAQTAPPGGQLDAMMSGNQPGPDQGPPPDAGGGPPMDLGSLGGAAAQEPPPNPDAKTYDQANVSAAKRLKARNAKQGN